MITIYTDGACSGNPGPGGWGALIIKDGQQEELFGGEPQTTNNRMEMLATIKALSALPPSSVTLYTDSTYVQKGITEWLNGWKRNGWRTAAKKPVKNVDLWQELDTVCQQHQVSWQWIKGHAGHAGNERADALARKGITIAHTTANNR